MNEMNNIKSTIEGVINAINSVIQVDVTVIGRDHNRIAATGLYVDQIGKKVATNSVFYKALHTGQEFIVESPRQEEVCQDCERISICEEYAEVCCPIFLDDEVVGIIGLVAFDMFQKEQILSNKLNLLNFLKKMAELISAKMLENRHKEQVIRQSKEIEVLLNYIDSAVVSIDSSGLILRSNCKAKKILNLSDHKKIDECLPGIQLMSKIPISDRFEIDGENGVERYLYHTKPIIVDSKIEQVVLTFSKEEDLIHVMNDMVNMKQIITFEDIVGDSDELKKVISAAKKSSQSNSTVLIQGDSGTGKELFARAIHFESNRKHAPFVAINCAAIPESLIESELFGYSDGAFTGALKGGKPGKFEIANKGTIFLDEIGDMPIHLQSKLLRVLQEREVERIGSKYSVPIDVRVIAATHQDLNQLIKTKNFRADLFYRLNVIPIQLKPLKDRISDVIPLSKFFLERYNNKLNKHIIGFHDAVMAFFNSYPWQGNIREMENIIEYAVNMCKSDTIMMDDLPEHIISDQVEVKSSDVIHKLDFLEREEIKKAINRYPRNKEGIDKVVEVLGISRATLYRKIKTYKL